MARLNAPETSTTFSILRLLALLIAGISTVIGVGYLIIAALGPEVWWPSGGGLASGAFVDFPFELRLVNAAAFLLWWLTVASMALIVASLLGRIRHGVRFVPAVTVGAWSLAIALAVGSTVSRIVENIARNSTLNFDGVEDPSHPVGGQIYWNIGPQVLVPDLPLLAVSVVLGLLAYVIGAGERLQRDTEGLV
ncbi:MAG: hypothetical protein ABIS08_00810 [Pseudolysinimonas sp.]